MNVPFESQVEVGAVKTTPNIRRFTGDDRFGSVAAAHPQGRGLRGALDDP